MYRKSPMKMQKLTVEAIHKDSGRSGLLPHKMAIHSRPTSYQQASKYTEMRTRRIVRAEGCPETMGLGLPEKVENF